MENELYIAVCCRSYYIEFFLMRLMEVLHVIKVIT